MNTLLLLANLLTADVHHSIWSAALVDPIGGLTFDSVVAYNSKGLAHDGNELVRGPLIGDCVAATGSTTVTCAGIAAASGAIASLSGSLATLSATVGQNSTDITTLQGQVGQAPVGATNGSVAANGQVGEFIQTCRAKGSAVTISGTTTLVSLSLPAGVYLVSATPTETGTLVGTSFAGAIAVNSSTMPSQASAGGSARQETSIVASLGADSGLNIVNQPVTLTGSGTVNVLATTTLSLGTASGYACASALRIH